MNRPLEAALRNLAAPAGEQLARCAPDLCAVDQLVLDFELALADALDPEAPDGCLVPGSVVVFDYLLGERSRDDAFRSDHALRASPDWAEVRGAAAEALADLAAVRAGGSRG